MVAHITLQHSNMFKISFLIFLPTTLVILFTNVTPQMSHSLTKILHDYTEKESKKRRGSVHAIHLEERVS